MPFISCNSQVEIVDGDYVLSIPKDYIGSVDEKISQHWYFKALVKDGVIKTVGDTKDSTLEAAQAESKKQAKNKQETLLDTK